MSQINLGSKAFIAGEDLEVNRRVKLSSGSGDTVEYADAGEAFIGITASKVVSGDFVTIELKTSGRTFKLVVDGAVSVGGDIYGANDGKVGATVSGSIIGKVLEEATADSEVVEGILF